MIRHLGALVLILLGIAPIAAQDYFPTNSGVKTKNTNFTAITNATLHPSPGETIERGTLLLQYGKITAIGKNVSVPKNATVVDMNGKHIYPSFIELVSDFGIKKTERSSGGRSYQYEPGREGYYWNDHIRPEIDALTQFDYDAKSAESFRKAGFGTVQAHVPDGLARGTSILVTLDDKGDKATRLLDANAAQFFSFDKSALSNQAYPSSKMGSTALIRQVFVDADWYDKGNVPTKDLALEALNDNMNLPQVFVGEGLYDDLRIASLTQETGVPFVIVGGGDEYNRIDEIKETGATYILPLDFPNAYDLENPYQADYVALSQMRQWNQAPTNPAEVAKTGLTFALSTHSLKSPNDFMKNLQTAIEHGLDKEKAIAALTTVPAAILNKENVVGSLKKGTQANFLVMSGPAFEDDTKLYENWVQGDKYVIEDDSAADIDGTYTTTLNGKPLEIKISKSTEKPSVTAKMDTVKLGSKIAYADDWVNITLTGPNSEEKSFVRFVGKVSDEKFTGRMIDTEGSESPFVATKKTSTATEESLEDDSEEKDEDEEDKNSLNVFPITYPNVAYGFKEQPKAQDILFKNATVWTGEDSGTLENTDVLIKNGKISKIGSDLSARGAEVIDATGKHLTAGIVDEHSHIAAFSINEGGQNSSAEVRMRDVIDPDDIDIYRNLAGGVTAIQLLHGSANPIGGQSAVMKLKWGASIDEMLLEDTKFIKFALGENVKQSNWGSTTRFPQTRMGVQQLYTDYFQRAKEYMAKKTSGQPYRKDYELETLAEILNRERFISCHSYVQSEINMLMKVAENFDFNINTFTHILEGYKVADKMAEHGVAGSTFSDWWAYKYEVNDAIPYNAAIMHSQGVLTAINSDDAEMARRLNQEAAKTMKYGGVTEEEAWKFVTLNPATMLHLDDRMGSIKEGKDADVVLWSTHPMSISARAEKTMVEGVVYFDIDRDREMRDEIRKEKNELATMMLAEKNKGMKTQPVKKEEKQHMHCDTMETIK
ncbi:MAG: amidohydrolase family protein [Leeuwenhoekiella sp.]